MTDNERFFRIVRPGEIYRGEVFAHSDEIATAMMEAGLWEEFVDWHEDESRDCWVTGPLGRTMNEYLFEDVIGREAHAEILVIPELLKLAIIAWREGK